MSEEHKEAEAAGVGCGTAVFHVVIWGLLLFAMIKIDRLSDRLSKVEAELAAVQQTTNKGK